MKKDGAERGFNEEYLGICAHYGIEPRTINVGRPQENGDCEIANGRLKRRVRQHLLLRGSRDFGAQEVAQLPRHGGDRGGVIDFRHVIGHLLRKPGAFAGYRWREEMFPAPVFRAAYDHLTRISTAADRRYLEILKVAADEGQTLVENALEHLLGAPNPVISAKEVRGMLDTWRDLQRQWRERPPLEVCLKAYDALMDGGDEDEPDEPSERKEVAV